MRRMEVGGRVGHHRGDTIQHPLPERFHGVVRSMCRSDISQRHADHHTHTQAGAKNGQRRGDGALVNDFLRAVLRAGDHFLGISHGL